MIKFINHDQIYLNIAKEYSKFSKCQFTKVGAIAVNERGRIIATGVNGTISGSINCCDMHFKEREDHVPFTTENEIHAELNLILDLAKSGATYKSLSIYLTISPCEECFKVLLGLTDGDTMKIDRIVYSEKYHRTSNESIERMKFKASQKGVQFYQVNAVQ